MIPSLNLPDYFDDGAFGNIIVASRNSETCAHAPDPRSNSNDSGLTPDDAIDLLFKVAGITDKEGEQTKTLATNLVNVRRSAFLISSI
jgi:hypothetical protein